MAQSYEINENASQDDETPTAQHETERAKLYLQKFNPAAGDSLYDHISEVLSKVLAERPKDALASFEKYSKKLRDEKYISGNILHDKYTPPPQYEEAKKLIELFKTNVNIKSTDEDYASLEEADEEDSDTKALAPNLFDLLYYFEQTDVGLPRSEIVILNLSIRKLIAKGNIKDVRFWGKILGNPKNYYVLEASLTDEELEKRLEQLEKENEAEGENESAEEDKNDQQEADQEEDLIKQALKASLATKLDEAEDDDREALIEEIRLKLKIPPIPQNKWTPRSTDCAMEKYGTGVNKKVYFVCNKPGLDDWIELPPAMPHEIVLARQIVQLFTGNLERPIYTFPPYRGCEKNYLRAQIARISAATYVSPIGYYKLGAGGEEDDENDDEDDEEVEEGEGAEVRKNKRYEPLPIKDLIDSSMSNWCHHNNYLLKQGRIKWIEPGKTGDEDEDEDEDEEDEEAEEGDEDEESKEDGSRKAFEREVPPPLLTPLSEDAASDSVTPWAVRLSSKVQPDTAIVLVRSNVWPGACAFAADKKCENVYIGWGHKHNSCNYIPASMQPIQDQYALDSELVEIQDPTFEEEEAYRIAHLPPPDDEEEEGETEDDEED